MNLTVTKHVIMKAIELILVCFLLSLLFSCNMGIEDHAFLSSGTFLGYLIIFAGLLLGGILNAPVDIKVDIFYSLIGCGLFVAVGIIFVQEPYKSISTKQKIKGYMSIFTGVFLFVDAISVILYNI